MSCVKRYLEDLLYDDKESVKAIFKIKEGPSRNLGIGIDNFSSDHLHTIFRMAKACDAAGVVIDHATSFPGGWQIYFAGFEGDAISYDHDYTTIKGSPRDGEWETCGFPWDKKNGVSRHDCEWIANSIKRLLSGEKYKHSWEPRFEIKQED